MRRFLTFSVCSLLYLLSSIFSPVQAASPTFAVSQETIYQVHENGSTTVTQNMALTNLTSEYYPQDYSFPINKSSVSNFKASDAIGPLPTELDNDQVRVRFTSRVAGLGKVSRWTLVYEQSGLAQKPGRLWKIAIPPQPKIAGLTTRGVRLTIPTSFGRQVFVKPQPRTSDLFWDQNSLEQAPIQAVFDPTSVDLAYETYDFILKYQVYNSRLYPAIYELALPSDSPYQKIALNSLTPKPENVVIDPNGNWLGQFQLGPTARLEIMATGSAVIYAQPTVGGETLPPSLDDLKAARFWPASDSLIIDVANKLGSAKEIFDYVSTYLSYSPSAKNDLRQGARAKIATPTGATSADFSDLFITLARAKKIPAREVNGVVIDSQPRLHVWPQFFDKEHQVWQMTDPLLSQLSANSDYFQWLDFNHLTLFINDSGKSAILPNSLTIKAVSRSVDKDSPSVPLTLASLSFPRSITAGFPANGTLHIENLGPTVFAPESVSLTANQLEFANQLFLTGKIAPLGHKNFEVKALPTPWILQDDAIISLRFGPDKQTYPVKIVPVYKNLSLISFIVIITLGIISIIAQIARSLYLRRR